jgi:predicted unusual protein kinase regulating ubiquinone biosynthesis (AarF/ABC1/UbiB family)
VGLIGTGGRKSDAGPRTREAGPPALGALDRFFDPIASRHPAERMFGGLLQERLLPLLGRFAEGQARIRTERARTMAGRARRLADDIRNLSPADYGSAKQIYTTASRILDQLEPILHDADDLSFHGLATLRALRAACFALRSSRGLWSLLHAGDALKQPDLQREAIAVLSLAEQAVARAGRGEDIDRELRDLQRSYAEVARRLDQAGGGETLEKTAEAIDVARRVWSYRTALEQAALKHEDREAASHMSHADLARWVRENGLPPQVIARIAEEDVAKNLLAFAEGQRGRKSAANASLKDRARELADALRTMEPSVMRSVDQLESKTKDLSAQLDLLLSDAEQIADPLSGPVRALRAASASLLSLRRLFLALRVIGALSDPEFIDSATRVAEQVSSLARSDEKARELANVEQALSAFGAEIERRLKIDRPKAIESGVTAAQAAQKWLRLKRALADAISPEVREALAAVGNLEMSPEARRLRHEAALGDPLNKAVSSALVAIRDIDLGLSFAEAGRAMNDLLRFGGAGGLNPMLAKSPLAFLGRADFEHALGKLDRFLASADTEEARAHLDLTLNVLRAAIRVETGNVERVAFSVPEGKRVEVASAIGAYVASLAVLAMQMAADELSAPSGEAAADFLDSMIGMTASQLDRLLAAEPRELGKPDVDELKKALSEGARDNAVQAAAHLPIQGPGTLNEAYAGKLAQLNVRLIEAMQCVESTADARDAVRRIFADIGSSARMIVHLVALFGAATNDQMDVGLRSEMIRSSVQKMGPLFVKMMQTLANIQRLIDKVSGEEATEKHGVLFESLKKLQDECEPLPWDVVKEQIERSLERPVDQAFLWIDPVPLKSGSIGQTHRARIRTDSGEIEDVVVKVLRPGIEKQFEETIRVTQLTISIFRELLRLDSDGAIFGDLKAQAETMLPMLERALPAFIESFKVETDIPGEARNMKAFTRMLGPSRYVGVPLVYDSHTKGDVLTMQEIKGFKLSRWLERYAYAKDAPPLIEEMGPLDPARAEEDARERAIQWVEEMLDAKGQAQIVRKHHGWYRVRVDAGHELDVFVREKTGRIHVKGTLPPIPRRAAEQRVAKWAEKRFGLPVRQVILEPAKEKRTFRTREGLRATILFDDDRQKSAIAFVDQKTGTIDARSLVPDLTEEGVGALRDRLASTFVTQVLKGLVHGDPHEGNFFVLPDGKTIVLIDFGLAIKFGLHEARGPLMLLSGAILNEPRLIAESLASMTSAPEADTVEGRAALSERLLTACKTMCEEGGPARIPEGPTSWWRRLKEERSGLSERTKNSTRSALLTMLTQLALKPQYLHGLKVAFSLSGNLAEIDKVVPRSSRGRQTLRAAEEMAAMKFISPLFGERAAIKKAERLDRISVLDVRTAQDERPA